MRRFEFWKMDLAAAIAIQVKVQSQRLQAISQGNPDERSV